MSIVPIFHPSVNEIPLGFFQKLPENAKTAAGTQPAAVVDEITGSLRFPSGHPCG
jgi:hypothetical protein